jgi:hypothetical protein
MLYLDSSSERADICFLKKKKKKSIDSFFASKEKKNKLHIVICGSVKASSEASQEKWACVGRFRYVCRYIQFGGLLRQPMRGGGETCRPIRDHDD